MKSKKPVQLTSHIVRIRCAEIACIWTVWQTPLLVMLPAFLPYRTLPRFYQILFFVKAADAYYLRTRALRRTAGLEQLRAFPLAPRSDRWYWFHAARVFVCTFYALSSGINEAILSVLIWSFTRLPPGSRRISTISGIIFQFFFWTVQFWTEQYRYSSFSELHLEIDSRALINRFNDTREDWIGIGKA